MLPCDYWEISTGIAGLLTAQNLVLSCRAGPSEVPSMDNVSQRGCQHPCGCRLSHFGVLASASDPCLCTVAAAYSYPRCPQ